jgi:peptidoglycan hydrolase-like protein with peptidoglycan-binding domain
MPNGATIPVDATLTTLSEEGRRQLDRDVIDEEDRVGGGSRTRRAVVFIGGGAGAGAVIGAIAGGGKGAAVGAGLGAVLGTMGVLLTKGEKAEVQPGTEFGMLIERSFTINSENTEALGSRLDNQQADLNSADSVRDAQIALRDKGFYRGPINGEMNFETRSALRNYQRDRNIAITGDLDIRTARELGVFSDQGPSSSPILNSPDAIRSAQTILRDRGIYNGPVNGQLTVGTQNALRNFQRDRNLPVTGELDSRTARELGLRGDGPVGPGPVVPGAGTGAGIGNPRQIAFLANRLSQDYKRDLNIRENRGQVVFDARRNFTENEVELLFQIDALQSAAQLYGQLATNITDPAALKGAADSLIRQMRLATRAMRRNSSIRISTIVMNDWEQLRSELRNITVTDNNLDSDVIR